MNDITDSVFEAVLKLDESFRAEYCFKNIEEQNKLCILKEKGAEGCPLILEIEDDEAIVPNILLIWSHPRFAKHFLENNDQYKESDYEICTLDLDLFKKSWIPSLDETNVGLGLMPINFDNDIDIYKANVLLMDAQQRAQAAKELAQKEKEEIEQELKEMEKAQNHK